MSLSLFMSSVVTGIYGLRSMVYLVNRLPCKVCTVWQVTRKNHVCSLLQCCSIKCVESWLLCRIRDETMMELGVQLEDRGDESVWKLEDPEVLRKAHQEKQQAAAEQKIKKLSMAHSKKDAVSMQLHLPVISLQLPLLGRCAYIVSLLTAILLTYCHWQGQHTSH